MVNLDIKFWGEKMKKIQFLVIAAILSFGLIISSAILSNMVEKVNKREDSISVKGVAERKVKANKGVLILTLMRSNKTAEDAYSKLEEDLTTIKDEITILDLVENEIEYSNIKTEPIYNGNTKIKKVKPNNDVEVEDIQEEYVVIKADQYKKMLAVYNEAQEKKAKLEKNRDNSSTAKFKLIKERSDSSSIGNLKKASIIPIE